MCIVCCGAAAPEALSADAEVGDDRGVDDRVVRTTEREGAGGDDAGAEEETDREEEDKGLRGQTKDVD
jgi:hypothetical protein